jgi:hypothetical protein
MNPKDSQFFHLRSNVLHTPFQLGLSRQRRVQQERGAVGLHSVLALLGHAYFLSYQNEYSSLLEVPQLGTRCKVDRGEIFIKLKNRVPQIGYGRLSISIIREDPNIYYFELSATVSSIADVSRAL